MIKIGDWYIMRMKDGSIWIRHEDGEGGQFDEARLADAIGKFYAENF